MYFLSRNLNYRLIWCMTRLCSTRKTYYDVLDLPRTCSDREIKQAFIRLSKEFHPDKNKNVKAQENFVRILEAYNVLGKPLSRARYDNTRGVEFTATDTNTSYEYPRNYYNYNKQYKTQATQNDETTFERNLAKQPKYVLVWLCIGIAVVGFTIQMVLIKKSVFLRREHVDEKSRYLQSELDKVRNAAKENGNEMQTRLLIEKITNASNPTIATAALGQALANPRKA